jgi:hypothetical protein
MEQFLIVFFILDFTLWKAAEDFERLLKCRICSP